MHLVVEYLSIFLSQGEFYRTSKVVYRVVRSPIHESASLWGIKL